MNVAMYSEIVGAARHSDFDAGAFQARLKRLLDDKKDALARTEIEKCLEADVVGGVDMHPSAEKIIFIPARLKGGKGVYAVSTLMGGTAFAEHGYEFEDCVPALRDQEWETLEPAAVRSLIEKRHIGAAIILV
ncbi:MAG: hypothetical protein AB7G06_04345 [Bdellovibrionales bacterium]